MSDISLLDACRKHPPSAPGAEPLGQSAPSQKPGEPQVLKPYHAAEALTVRQAAELAKRSVRTIREWASRFDLGRRIGGAWAISSVALTMHLEGNHEALALYHAGDRTSLIITAYFERCGVPLRRKRFDVQERSLSEPDRCSLP